MKPNSITISLTLVGVALGLACIEENFDPWQPSPEPPVSTWTRPIVDGGRAVDRAAEFPFDPMQPRRW